MALLDEPKVRVHFDRVFAEWTDKPLLSGAEVASMLGWDNPTVLDSLRAMFQCKEGETIKTLEVTQQGFRAFFMKIDGSEADVDSPALTNGAAAKHKPSKKAKKA